MEINELQITRILKFFSLALLAGGIFTAIISPSLERRIRALPAATIGFFGSWVAGYILMVLSGGSMRQMDVWIIWGTIASLLSFHGLAILGHKQTPQKITSVLALGGLLASIAVMAARSNDITTLITLTILSFAAGAVICFWPGLISYEQKSSDDASEISKHSFKWFFWIARWEGVSLILLVLVNMPLKKVAGTSLDGGTGTLGWIHGTLFLLYLQALLSTGKMQNWSLKQLAVGFIAANLPFGTFWFERWVRK